MLGNKELKELIAATRQHINLTEAIIEKNYYVTQAIHALSGTESDYFKLVNEGQYFSRIHLVQQVQLFY